MARRRTFGTTWWGGAWIDALEQRARLDPNRLPRGRTYARQDRVGALDVSPGIVEALVRGSRPQPYRVTVRVRVLSVDEWDRVLDAIAGRAGHAAALLDGELPAAVLADAQQAGVELLPMAGEVQPRCTCPDWADPCKHAAAVCYLVADELDRDPFALLHLRGRTRAEVLAALRDRRGGGASRDATRSGTGAKPVPRETAVVTAREAFARAQPDAATLLALGARVAPPQPGRPAPLPISPPPEAGFTAEALAALAADAAERAWRLLRGEGDGGLTLDAEADTVRRAAALDPDSAELTRLAGRVGMERRELARSARAWQHGGEPAWRVSVEDWSPARHPELAAAIHDGRRALAGAPELAGRVTNIGNRVTRADVQLRLDPEGRWWRFTKRAGAWEVESGPSDDPAALLRP